MLKADFHIHSKFSPDSSMSPESLVAKCLRVGLNCIAVTDHNTIRGALEVSKIAPFMVIIGSEIKSSQGEIVGLFIKEDVPSGLSAVETAKHIKEQGGLVSIPHPFDRFRRNVITREGLLSVLPYIDIIEGFNARNIRGEDNQKAQVFAGEHGLLTHGVTDSHSILEVGRTYTEIPEFDGVAQGFKEALAQGKIVGRPSHPLVHTISTYNKIKKRLLRRIGIR